MRTLKSLRKGADCILLLTFMVGLWVALIGLMLAKF